MDLFLLPLLGWPVLAAAGLIAIVAAAYDIGWRRIPNWVSLAGVVLGFAANLALDGPRGLVTAVAGLGLAVAIYFPLWMLHGVGAGDVKLMAAMGALVGPGHWFLLMVVANLSGAAMGLMMAARKGRFRSTLWNSGFIMRSLAQFRAPFLTREQIDVHHKEAIRMPHGVSIAVGVAVLAALTVWRGL
jgi:prepilin peptidase CpaA